MTIQDEKKLLMEIRQHIVVAMELRRQKKLSDIVKNQMVGDELAAAKNKVQRILRSFDVVYGDLLK